jgi:hypothetical protein
MTNNESAAAPGGAVHSIISRRRRSRDQQQFIETFERRLLLSASLHDIQNGPLAKAGGNLANLYINYRSAQKAGTLAHYQSTLDAQTRKANGGDAVDVQGNTVGVTVVGTGKLAGLEQTVRALGMDIQSITPGDDAVSGFIPISELDTLSQTPGVLHVNPIYKPSLYQQGSAPNQSDQALAADVARSADNLTGAGVKVGVISDSVNEYGGGLASSVASGDLPANVQVLGDLPEGGGTDEGRAILEEIYDIAPGASLAFDTAGDTQQSLASAVTALQTAGCKVIIDDESFEQEPDFQPGVIDAAINRAVAGGVTYVTAAGNSGTAGFEQAASFVPANDGSGDELINFSGSSANPATTMTLSVNGQAPDDITLQWDDPYDGVTGHVKADLTFTLLSADGTQVMYSSTDNAFDTGVPVQTITDVQPGTYQVEIAAVNTPTANLPGYYEFVGGQNFTSFVTQYSGTHTTVFGHAAFSNAISVGAVPFNDAPVFSNTRPIPTEDFSATGPAIEARDASGNLLPTAKVIDVPQVSAADGNNTSFFSPDNLPLGDPTSFPEFSGTSAAAGNAAGVVALLLQAEPSATPAQVLSALETSAIPVNGAASGTYDPNGGFGLIDTATAVTQLKALVAAGPGAQNGAPTATIVAVSPNPRTNPVTSIDINFNEPVTGFTLADLDLTINGLTTNLLTNNQTLTSTDGQNYVLNNLAPITAGYGYYQLTLSPSPSQISASNGQKLTTSATTAFLTEAITGVSAVPTHLTAQVLSPYGIVLNFNEPHGNGLEGYILQRSLNSSFSGKLVTTYLDTETTTYADNSVVPGTVYYYRLAAYNVDGTSAFSHAATAITYNVGEVILDTNSPTGVTISGLWSPSTAVSGYEGYNYLQDDNINKGQSSVKYHPDLASAGMYDVYASWTTAPDHAARVPYDIFSQSGDLLQTVYVNQRSSGGSGWVYLGEYPLKAGTASFVRIRNTGTTGQVIANGVKFQPAGTIGRNDGVFNETPPAQSAAIVRAQSLTSGSIPPGPAIAPDQQSESQLLRDEVQ